MHGLAQCLDVENPMARQRNGGPGLAASRVAVERSNAMRQNQFVDNA